MSHHASGPNFGLPLGDARLDMTDLYAFPQPGQPDRSVLILNVHPSFAVNPRGPTTKEPFAPGALYEIKIDTDGDAIADITYSAQFAACRRWKTDGDTSPCPGRTGGRRVRRSRNHRRRSTGVRRSGAAGGEAGEVRAFFGWRSDSFFNDANGLFKTCSSPATISSPTRTCAASCLNCPTRLSGATRWDSGVAPWRKLKKAGFRQIGEQDQSKRFSSQERHGSYTSRESRRTMTDSWVRSLMNWSTRAATTHDDAIAVAKTLLPDILSYDPRRPASFPHNGRTLTDDVFDVFLRHIHQRKGDGRQSRAAQRSAGRIPVSGTAARVSLDVHSQP